MKDLNEFGKIGISVQRHGGIDFWQICTWPRIRLSIYYVERSHIISPNQKIKKVIFL